MAINFRNIGEVKEADLKYAVIVSRHRGKWIWVKHKERNTWEIPGGTREANEPISVTAQRELYEETGANKYEIIPICEYCVNSGNKQSYGRLFLAEIEDFSDLPNLEIEEIREFTDLPDSLTYPEIEPFLFDHIKKQNRN